MGANRDGASHRHGAEEQRLPGVRLAGRVADARRAHRETGRPNLGPTDGIYRWRLARENLSRVTERWKGEPEPGSAELRLAGYREVEHEVETGAVPGRGIHLHYGTHCLDQLPADGKPQA